MVYYTLLGVGRTLTRAVRAVLGFCPFLRFELVKRRGVFHSWRAFCFQPVCIQPLAPFTERSLYHCNLLPSSFRPGCIVQTYLLYSPWRDSLFNPRRACVCNRWRLFMTPTPRRSRENWFIPVGVWATFCLCGALRSRES